MKNKELVKKFFDEQGKIWNKVYVEQTEYPTAPERMRVTLEVLKDKEGLNIIDLGCGAGQLVIELAKQGHRAYGVDFSQTMIDMANENNTEYERALFCCMNLEDITIKERYDVVIALGIIYHFKDDMFIDLAHRLLKKNGLFIVSCRNKLFNMTHPNWKMIEDIKDGSALKSIKEIQSIPKDKIPIKIVREMMSDWWHIDTTISTKSLPNYKTGRTHYSQHTPEHIKKACAKHGFKHLGFYGIHPHIISPYVQTMLPDGLYNRLTDVLLPFNKLSIALLWSSQFVGVFKKC